MPRDKRLYMTFPNDVHRHPKIMRLSLEARWAFIEMNGEARIADNDGVFSRDEAEFLWPQAVLDELCSSHPSRPLVVRDGETYVIRDYAEHQQTRAEREELSAKKAAAGAKGGRAKADNVLAGAKQVSSGVKQNVAEIESELEIKLEEQDQTLIVAERADVTMLCTLLADLIEHNGSKRPTIGKGWLDAARLMIDNDHRTVEDAAALIRWCQQDEFWRGNILSMPKFREKYDQLRLAAQKRAGGYKTNTEHNLEFLRRMAAEEQQAQHEMREVSA